MQPIERFVVTYNLPFYVCLHRICKLFDFFVLFNSGGSFIHFNIEIPVLTLGASESTYPETNGFYTGAVDN